MATGLRAVFSAEEKAARPLLLCCLFFMTAFMWLQFLAAWTIQKTTESTRLVQLSGFFQMGPLVFGPLLGKLADGTSKLKVEKVGLFFVLVCSGVIAAAALFQWPVDIVGAEVMAVLEAEGEGDDGSAAGDSSARTGWLVAIYAHVAVVGLGMTIFQVTHLVRLNAAVSPAVVPSAMACAICCFGIGGAVGNSLGGVVVDLWGVGAAYACDFVLFLLSFLLLFVGPDDEAPAKGKEEEDEKGKEEVQPPKEVESKEGTDAAPSAAPSWRHLCSNKAYLGVLGTTVLANLLYWGHIPFIQVIADESLNCTATEAGILASSVGYGNVVGCLFCAIFPPRRIGLAFTAGMLCASAVFAVAAVKSYVVVLIGLFVAHIGGGFFGATQATLVMMAVPVAQHGVGMGVLTLAIGAQAAGMLLFGESGEALGPSETVLLFAAVGAGTQALFWLALPDCSRMVARERTEAEDTTTKPPEQPKEEDESKGDISLGLEVPQADGTSAEQPMSPASALQLAMAEGSVSLGEAHSPRKRSPKSDADGLLVPAASGAEGAAARP